MFNQIFKQKTKIEPPKIILSNRKPLVIYRIRSPTNKIFYISKVIIKIYKNKHI